jgi:hypothetical protein
VLVELSKAQGDRIPKHVHSDRSWCLDIDVAGLTIDSRTSNTGIDGVGRHSGRSWAIVEGCDEVFEGVVSVVCDFLEENLGLFFCEGTHIDEIRNSDSDIVTEHSNVS